MLPLSIGAAVLLVVIGEIGIGIREYLADRRKKDIDKRITDLEKRVEKIEGKGI